MINQLKALEILEEFKDKVFFDDDILETSKQAYLKTVNEKVTKDLHNSSTLAIESLIDDLLLIDDDNILQPVVSNTNPIHLAFLHARIGNALICFSDPANAYANLPSSPKQFLRWALVDLWKSTPDSDDRY